MYIEYDLKIFVILFFFIFVILTVTGRRKVLV